MRTIGLEHIRRLKNALADIAGCLEDIRGILPRSMIPENPGYENIRDLVDNITLGRRKVFAGQGVRAGVGESSGLLIQFADLRLPAPRFFESAAPAEFPEWLAGFEQSITINLEIVSLLELLASKNMSGGFGFAEGCDAARKRLSAMSESRMYPGWVREWYAFCAGLLGARV